MREAGGLGVNDENFSLVKQAKINKSIAIKQRKKGQSEMIFAPLVGSEPSQPCCG